MAGILSRPQCDISATDRIARGLKSRTHTQPLFTNLGNVMPNIYIYIYMGFSVWQNGEQL